MQRLPSLNALRAFECVARLGAVNRAAEEMNVTESAVSRQVRALEEDLRVELFRRVHRGVRLSPEGEQLLRYLGSAFDTIRRGVEQIRARPGEVRVRTPPTFGSRWLLPRLRDFEMANPDMSVRVTILWENMEPSDAENDVGVVYESRGWPEEELIPFLHERLTPVCSPAFLASVKAKDTAEMIRSSQLLHCSVVRDWERWVTTALPGESMDVARGEIFDTMDTALRAAEAGRGFAIADLAMVDHDLALGRLVAPFPTIAEGVDNFYIVRRDRLRPKPEVTRFIDWLFAQVRADGAAG
ncbi:LysR substrate-binding domain-containing protein [Oryzibacter oryziterrae]|uniref:LysR substrate-binding domain-containing protein n=1 Tax=Oryzibacter oryziterrae TaxID=2766474 RepID=UPI001F454B89|nr:LysR substrate-binding domain-containing protein [Oryzibacter oryziterrae]